MHRGSNSARSNFAFFWRALLLAVAFSLITPSANSQSSLRAIAVDGQPRDAIVDSVRQHVYISLYREAKLLRLDAITFDVIDTVDVGVGPSALAVSADGSQLACVNRLDETVSIVDLASGTVQFAIPAGGMPSDIAALPGGGFAVANAFDDTITLIDSIVGNVSATLDPVSSVPAVLAASSEYLAIGVWGSPAVHLYGAGAAEPARSIAMPSAPVAIAALTSGDFAVATSDELLVLGADTGRTLHRKPFAAVDLVAVGDRLLAASSDEVLVLDNSLSRVSESGGGASLTAVSGGADSIVAVSASADRAYVAGANLPQTRLALEVDEEPTIASDAFPAPAPETESSPAPVVAEPDPEPESEPLVADEPEAPRPVAEPQPSDPDPAQSEDFRSSEPAESVAVAQPSQRKPRYHALQMSRFGGRSHAPELGRGADKIFEEKLDRALTFEGPSAGLLGLNWEQTPEPERFDSWVRRGGIDTFEGDVEFAVDDAVVNTDHLIRDEEARRMRMDTPMSVTRENESMTASSLEIRGAQDYFERDEIPPFPVLPRGYEPPRRFVEQGELEATDVDWQEPLRALQATRLIAQMETRDFEAENARGHAGDLYFDAKQLRVAGPESAEVEEAWLTTCDREHPHYAFAMKKGSITDGDILSVRSARLKLWGHNTPFYVPRFRTTVEDRRYRPDFEFGSGADIGAYANLGLWYSVSPYYDLGFRFMPTTRDGVGFGIDSEFDYSEKPASPFFRSRGSLRTLYTTEDRGYADFRYRQELSKQTIFLGQYQQWSDRHFLDDFFHDRFTDQTGPRTFANLTNTRPGQIFTVTASPTTHGFLEYTEKLPEATYHLLDRRVFDNFYFSLDSYAGYYEFDPTSFDTGRSVNIARLSYDLQLGRILNVTPFVEGDLTAYENRLGDEDSDTRIGVTGGVTLQSRFQKSMRGIGPYEGLKHVVIPSVSYIHRPDPSMDFADTPQLDLLDLRPGRSRIESKLENIILARHGETGDVWQLMNLAFYQGYDLESEIGESEDYELEFQFRPIPKWGLFASAERHDADDDPAVAGGSYDRLTSYIFYDNRFRANSFNARLGYSYTDLPRPLEEREWLYGAGVRLGKKWSLGFEHRFDVNDDELQRQIYEVRRLLHKWETAIRVRDRNDGLDVSVSFTLIDFPAAALKF